MIAPCDKQHHEELNCKGHSCLWLGQVLDHHLLPPKPAKPCLNTLSLLPTGFAIATSGCGSAESRLEIHGHSRPRSLIFSLLPFPRSLTCVENLLEWSEVEQHVERPFSLSFSFFFVFCFFPSFSFQERSRPVIISLSPH